MTHPEHTDQGARIAVPPIGYPGLRFLLHWFLVMPAIWAFGMAAAIGVLTGELEPMEGTTVHWWDKPFTGLWLALWATLGMRAPYLVLGLFIPAEEIEIAGDRVAIGRGSFGENRDFARNQVKHATIEAARSHRLDWRRFAPDGGWTVAFEHDGKWHRIGRWLHKDDARTIVEPLRRGSASPSPRRPPAA